MRDMSMTQEARDLAGEVLFRIPVRDEDVLQDDWHMVAYNHLGWAKNTLTAIHCLIGQGALHPAGILLRHLFELAVTLLYLDKHPEQRPDFVRHSYCGPLPKRAWRPLNPNPPKEGVGSVS